MLERRGSSQIVQKTTDRKLETTAHIVERPAADKKLEAS